MKFEQATLPLRPRTLSQCLDLALLLLRAHAGPFFKLWSLVSIPACLFVYLAVYYAESSLSLALLVFWFVTPPLGMLMVAAAAPSAFGETPTVRSTFASLGASGWLLLIKLWGVRLLSPLLAMFGLLPGAWLLTRTGFLTEQTVLSRLDKKLHDRRTSELLQGEIVDLMFRALLIVGYCGILTTVVFLTLDAVAWSLSFPILTGRIVESIDPQYFEVGEIFNAVWLVVTSDPVVVTSLLAVSLLLYPVGRLAWLLCYIDLRVRRDCWDMELQILQEARRLEEA